MIYKKLRKISEERFSLFFAYSNYIHYQLDKMAIFKYHALFLTLNIFIIILFLKIS